MFATMLKLISCSILAQAQFYPTTNLANSISPEYRAGGSGFTDLLVTSNDFTTNPPTRRLQIIFEGKGTGGGSWGTVLGGQLGPYANSLVQSGTQCYLILAKQDEVMFWVANKAATSNTLVYHQLVVDATTHLVSQYPLAGSGDDNNHYNLVTDEILILDMLGWMVSNPGTAVL